MATIDPPSLPPEGPGPGTELVSIGAVSRALGLSPSRIRQLADLGRLSEAERTEGGHRRFDLQTVRREWTELQGHRTTSRRRTAGPPDWRRSFPLLGAAEDEIWNELNSGLSLHGSGMPLLRYVVTEMVNNTIDHSDGSIVTVDATVAGRIAEIRIRDDGVGIFHRLATGLGLSGDIEALGELTKGKRTTDPQHHSGEGIFFSSKAVDRFEIRGNGLLMAIDNPRNDVAIGVCSIHVGTEILVRFDLDTVMTLQELFAAFTDDLEFNRTRPRVDLFEIDVAFVSRSEAKRLAVGLEEFEVVELDFTGVESIGQGFADELFRVWATDHPNTELIPINMNGAVAFMIERVRESVARELR